MKNRLGHLPRTSWTRGIWICFRACSFLGSWPALLCGEVHIRAGRDCSVFEESMTAASACRRVVRAKCCAVHSGQFTDYEARPVLTPCQDEGMSSGMIRGYWKLGAIGCRGALWSKELDGKELHGSPGARENRSQEFPVFWTTSSHRLLVPHLSSATQ